MCAFFTLLLFGPRVLIFFWWLFDMNRWERAFDTFIWPLIGFLLLPWMTLMWVVVAPGGITGFDYFWLGLALLFDAFSWFGGGYTNRGRMTRTS